MTGPRLVRRNHGRGHSYRLDGQKVPGVTTVVGNLPKPALIDWAGRVTAEYAVDHWDDLANQPPSSRLNTLTRARYASSSAAALRGSQIHDLGARASMGEAVDAGPHQSEVEAYARFLDRWDVDVIATETPVANTAWGYAGTADAWANVGRGPLAGARVLLDIKTGGRVYDETALQLTGYRYCDLWHPSGPESEEPLPPVDAVVVAHVLTDTVEVLPVEADERQWRQFQYLLATTAWLDDSPHVGAALELGGDGMTDVTPYVPADLGRRSDLLNPETDSWIASMADVVQLASYICNTTFVPQGLRGSAPATAATILYGREIGIPPITALQTMHVINGRVGMAAELMRARVLAAGHDLETLESTSAVCRMRGRRRGSETWTTVAWSKGDAQQAGLGGDGWKKYPRAMLVARASAELCRLVFPDVTHGMAALEELDGADRPSSSTTPEAPAPTRKVARAPRTPSPEPHAEPAGVVSETPPPGEGVHTVVDPPTTPPVVVPETPSVRVAPPAPPAPVRAVPDLPEPPSPPDLGDPAGTREWDPNEVAQPVDPEADPYEQGTLKGDGPASQAQVRHVMILLRQIVGATTRDERMRIGQALVERRVQSFSELSMTDAGRMITVLLTCRDSDNPRQMLRFIVDESHRRMDEPAPELDADPPE